jgi:hypothetical protein
MAFISYVPEEHVPAPDRVSDRDNILRIHGVHPRTMRLHHDLYLELMRGPVERKTRQKIEVVQQKVRDLQRMKRTLERLAAACRARRPTDDCPILAALEDHDDADH